MSEPRKELTLAEKIAKLPKWAQEYIQDAERTRAIAERELKEYGDNQTPSAFSIQEYVNGKYVTRYVQTHRMQVEAHGVRLNISVEFDRDKKIGLSWGPAGQIAGMDHVGFFPTSFQQAELRSKENMR
jgi:hypothetical protein